MKKLTTNLMIILFAISGLMNTVLAQAPEGIIYQAEARNSNNNLIINQALDVKIIILQDIPTGSVVYEELHKVTTNAYGMFVLVIGQGTNTPGLLLENVDWGNHSHFLNVQVKKTKATVWINMGTSQLLSVPYALHAKTATEAFTADYNYLYNVPQNVSHFNNDAGYITAADNTDPDPTNEIQDLQLVDNILTITKNGNATQIDLSFYLDETDPIFTSSEAAKIGAGDIDKLNKLSGTNTGDQDLSHLATTTDLTTGLNGKVDKETGKGLSTEDYTTEEKGKIANLSGVNTGDQDITPMIHSNREALNAVIGINTGDQDLSAFATKADLDNKVDKEAGKRLFPNGATLGQINYWNGTDWVSIPPGANGQTLTFCNGIPTWGPCPTTVLEVTSTTGAIWMDRNLGASQVATSSADAAAYGDLYQWGRSTDGHQIRTSGTTATLSSSDSPGHGNFINGSGVNGDWRSPQNNNLWQGVNGVNNPCPTGYRLPTNAEWDAERSTWTSNNAAGAFVSPLKLPATGARNWNDGSFAYVGSKGYYWSSTSDMSGFPFASSRYLGFGSDYASMGNGYRAMAISVRCIKDAGTTGSIPSVTTSEVDNITLNTATGGGEVTSGGGAMITARGVCWSTTQNPTIDLITKTVDGTGTGAFTSSITGLALATSYYVRAYATNSVGTAYGNEVFFTTPALAAGEVYNPTTGKIWMDRNLGASRVATSSADAAAYGDLYQWGRGTDGHQIRTSGVTTTLSSFDSPGHSNFIASQSPDYDWRTPQNTSLWQGVNGINNPCPGSYRLPTEAEFNAERLSWSNNNTTGAFTSQLKLTTGGYRNGRYGGIEQSGSGGYYCTSTVEGVNSRNLSFNSSMAGMFDYNRSYGLSVRCIKD